MTGRHVLLPRNNLLRDSHIHHIQSSCQNCLPGVPRRTTYQLKQYQVLSKLILLQKRQLHLQLSVHEDNKLLCILFHLKLQILTLLRR